MGIFQKLWTDSESNRRETAHLQAEVAAGTTSWDDAVTFDVPDDATVEKVVVWHTPGSESALRTRPRRVEQNRRYDLPEYAENGEDFITGEPEGAEFLTNESVEAGQQIVIEAKNTNTNYAYRFAIRVTFDYAGGTSRFLGGGS